jgi:hypothetical protein
MSKWSRSKKPMPSQSVLMMQDTPQRIWLDNLATSNLQVLYYYLTLMQIIDGWKTRHAALGIIARQTYDIA